jgi:hypothetical protein
VPIELVAVLAGVKAIEGIVDGTLAVVDSIRSRFGGNDEAKHELDAKLAQLQVNLADVGKLGEAAGAYLEALKEVRSLQVDVLLVDQYLDYNADPLRNHLNPGYPAAWSAVAQLLDTFDRDRDLARQVQLARKEWFDVADDQMLTSRFNDVNAAFVSVDERTKGRRLDDLAAGLESLHKPLTEIEVLLQSTLVDKILPGVQQLRSITPGAAGA